MTRLDELIEANRCRSLTDDEQREFDAAIASRVAAVTAQASADKMLAAEAADIVRACIERGVPEMASSLIAEGVSLADARTRISGVDRAARTVSAASQSMARELARRGMAARART